MTRNHFTHHLQHLRNNLKTFPVGDMTNVIYVLSYLIVSISFYLAPIHFYSLVALGAYDILWVTW